MSVPPSRVSSYLDDLPAVFRDERTPSDGPAYGLGRLLLAFEHVLTGVGLVDDPGLEEYLDGAVEAESGRRLVGVERYFDPGLRGEVLLPELARAPDDFLDWLASWVALVPRADVSVASDPERRAVERRLIIRRLIARSIELYRMRGTVQGLADLLAIYALGVRIEEPSGWLQVGVDSTVGVDTRLDGPPPHFFSVVLAMPEDISGEVQEEMERRRRLLEEIVEAEKPAHTYYEIIVDARTLQVGVRSTVGVDTLLG